MGIGKELIEPVGKEILERSVKSAKKFPIDEAMKASRLEAWHASPHSYDKVDLSKSGTGQGAAKFGHGFYAAQHKAVAVDYQKEFSRYPTVGGKMIFDVEGFRGRGGELLEGQGYDVAKARALVERDLPRLEEHAKKNPDFSGWVDDYKDALSFFDRVEAGGGAKPFKAKLYKLDIDATHDDLLDWDLPFSQQPKKVQDAINKLGLTDKFKEMDATTKEAFGEDGAPLMDSVTGKSIYEEAGIDAKELSETLRAEGVKGVKFADQLSRGQEGGTSNFVIFDDELISITGKWGVGGMMAYMGLGALAPDQAMAEEKDVDDMLERYERRQESIQQQEASTMLDRYEDKQAGDLGSLAAPSEEPEQSKDVEGRRDKANEKRKTGEREKTTGEKVAVDMAVGTVEMPRQIVGGVIDAANETIALIQDIDQMFPVDQEISLKGVPRGIPQSGPDLTTIPTTPEATTTTGGMVRGITQFMAGFFGAGKLAPIKAIMPVTTGGRILKASIQSAIASFVALDPQEGRLSNLIQQFPTLANPVNEYLAYEEGDSAMEGRLKNALEDAMLGVPIEGIASLMRALKVMRKARQVKKMTEEVPELKEAIEAEAKNQEIQKQELGALLGDRSDPLTNVSKPELVEPDASDLSRRFGAEMDANYQTLLDEYNLNPETHGGKLLSADEAKELSPDFRGDRSLAGEVHGPSSKFVNRRYKELLKESPKEGEGDSVVFMGGGAGAGKTTALKSKNVNIDVDSHQIIFDGTLKSYKNSKAKIEQAIAADKDVLITWVYRDPEEAFKNGAITRAAEMEAKQGTGRTLPIDAFIKTHKESPKSVIKLIDDYEGSEHVTFRIIDNSKGFGNATDVDIDFLKNIADNDIATENLKAAAKEAYEKGQISKQSYEGFVGKEKASGGAGRPDGQGYAEQFKHSVKGQRSLETEADELISKTKARAEGEEPPPELFVNWSRIDTEDDIKQIIQDAADTFKPEIDKSRRGVVGWEQTKLDADQLDAWEILERRRADGGGSPLNNAETQAVRELWVSSAARLKDLSDKIVASKDNPSEASLIAFRKMLAVHNSIQNQVIAARTETARALNAWKIPAGDTVAFGGQMEALRESIANGGGSTVQIAKRLKMLNDAGKVKEADAFIHGSPWAKSADMVAQLWYFSLLSGPHTHMRNMLSNTAVIGMEMVESKAANLIGKARGMEHVVDGEATAQMFGLVQGIRDAFRISKKTEQVGTFWQSVKTGESGFGIGKVEQPRLGAFSSEKLQLDPQGAMGRVADWVDVSTTVPGRMLAAEDEIFKTINFRMEINAQAHRKAMQEFDAGTITKDQFKDRVASLLNNPDEAMQLAARSKAQVNTFTDSPEKTETFKAFNALGNAPIIGKVALPFRRTPYNIAKYTFERTPLAPLVKRWRDDIAAGGAKADKAWSKFLVGNSILLAAVDMSMNGDITGEGSSNFAQRTQTRRQGIQPMSVRVRTGEGENDFRYFNYRGLEPLATPLGIASNMVEILEHTDWEDDNAEIDELVIAATMAIAGQVTSQQYMSGVSAFFEAMADPKRYGATWWRRLSGAVSPTALAQVARVQDPYARYVNSMIDSIKARTPGLSKTLPRRLDTWGRPIDRSSGLGGFYDAISPVYSKEYKPQPIDKELDRLEKYLARPGKRTGFKGANINMDLFPHAYWRWVELSGNEMTETTYGAPITAGAFVSSGKGMMEELNLLVTGKHPNFSPELWDMLSDGSDGGKASQIDAIVRAYRDEAKEYLLEEFPALKAHVDTKADKKAAKFKFMETM